MGFRFRKSFGKGPFRVNVSKSGVGYSVGTKGLRYTKKAGGGTRTTASIPGTGISYVTESGSKTSASRPAASSGVVSSSSSAASSHVFESNTRNNGQQRCTHCNELLEPGTIVCPYCRRVQGSAPKPIQKQKKPFYQRGWFAAILAVGVLAVGGAALGDNSSPEPELNTAPALYATEAVPVLATEADPEPLFTEESTLASRPTGGANLEAIFAGQSASAYSTGNSSKTNYILNTSTHIFHYPSCNDVDKMDPENKQSFNGSRTEAIAMGYDPCGHCDP